MFKLEMETGGAAFRDEDNECEDQMQEAMEITRILENVVGELACGLTHGTLMDINGNKVGSWSRQEEEK